APGDFEPSDLAPGQEGEDGEAAARAGRSARGRAEPAESVGSRACYICKRQYSDVHQFYDRLCGECGDFYFSKRTELAELHGRGARAKRGYQAALKLLRSGARLIVTTRFPRDAAARYAAEPDFPQWRDRLEIFGLDLRHTPSVEAFCGVILSTHGRLDYLINN